MKKRSFLGALVLLALTVTGCNDPVVSSSSKNPSTSVSSSEVSSSKTSSSTISSTKSSSSSSSSSTSSRPSSSTTTSSSTTSINTSSSSSTSSTSSINERPEGVTLDIFAFNDTHGNVKDTQDKGLGIAKTSTLLKELTADKNSILISQGDMRQGSVESNFTKGNLVTEWMNQMNFVSMTVGNHEYDWGKEYIIQNQELANFPTLGINVLNRNTNTRVDYLSPSVTFERGGAKIGVIGAIGNCLGSISSSKVKDVYFATGSQLSNLVKAESTRLRNEEKCDFIIYSIHGAGDRDNSDSYDLTLSNDHYVDIVLEGHTHEGYAYQDEGGIYHIQNYAYNESFTQITVDLNLRTGSFSVSNPVSYDMRNNYSPYRSYAEDATTNALFTKYYDYFSFAYEPLGYNDTYRYPDELKNKVAQLYLEEGVKKWNSQYNLVLGGGYISCRGSGLAVGTVYYSQLAELFPFDNEIVLCSIRGSNFANTQYITGNSNYYVNWSTYGESIRYNIDYSATYYLVTDTYTSDFYSNYMTIVDDLEVGKYARDLLADYVKEGKWGTEPPTPVTHAGTTSDPKTIAEAMEYAREHPGANVGSSGAQGFYYVGVVSGQAASISTTSGDMNNLYVKDEGASEDMQIYYFKRCYGASLENGNNWQSVDDLHVGDKIVFWGKAFYFNSYIIEFASGAYCYSINGNLTA